MNHSFCVLVAVVVLEVGIYLYVQDQQRIIDQSSKPLGGGIGIGRMTPSVTGSSGLAEVLLAVPCLLMGTAVFICYVMRGHANPVAYYKTDATNSPGRLPTIWSKITCALESTEIFLVNPTPTPDKRKVKFC